MAKRYAAPQIGAEDVKLEASAQTIQAFLDSEPFARVMADPAAVALLGDPKVRSAIGARAANRDATPSPVANAAIAAVIDDPSFVVLVTNPAFETSWHDAARQAAEINGALEKAEWVATTRPVLAAVSRTGRRARHRRHRRQQRPEGAGDRLGTGATGVNSGLKAQATGFGTGATGVNGGLKAQAPALERGASRRPASAPAPLASTAA